MTPTTTHACTIGRRGAGSVNGEGCAWIRANRRCANRNASADDWRRRRKTRRPFSLRARRCGSRNMAPFDSKGVPVPDSHAHRCLHRRYFRGPISVIAGCPTRRRSRRRASSRARRVAQLRPGGAVDVAESAASSSSTRRVTPRWLETSDRFWYAYQTREGRRVLDRRSDQEDEGAAVRSREDGGDAHLDHAHPVRRAAPAVHDVRFVKKDTAIEFDVQVPADASDRRAAKRETPPSSTGRAASQGAVRQPDEPGPQPSPGQAAARAARGTPRRRPPRNRTLHFEYDLATAAVTLLDDYTDEPRLPRWARSRPTGRPWCSRARTTSS